MGEETPPPPVMLSEAKHLPKAKHLALAGVEIPRFATKKLRSPVILSRSPERSEGAAKNLKPRSTRRARRESMFAQILRVLRGLRGSTEVSSPMSGAPTRRGGAQNDSQPDSVVMENAASICFLKSRMHPDPWLHVKALD